MEDGRFPLTRRSQGEAGFFSAVPETGRKCGDHVANLVQTRKKRSRASKGKKIRGDRRMDRGKWV